MQAVPAVIRSLPHSLANTLASTMLWLSMASCLAPAITHAATTSSTVNQATQSRIASDAEQASVQGRYSDAAAKFEELAALRNGELRDTASLKAARQYQLAGNDAKATELVTLLSPSLSPQNAVLRIVVSAASQLHAGHGGEALITLDQIPLPLPSDSAADILQVRVAALFATGRTVPAVNTAVERERTLKGEEALRQNRQLIWNGLKQSINLGRDLTPPPGASRITTGWLALAKLLNTENSDPFAFNHDLDDWRNRYAGHPANEFLPLSTTLPASTTNTLALLLPLSGKQAVSAQAIRDGFIAAALQGAHPRINVFDTDSQGAVAAYNQAVQAGADMIVGPLLKEDVDAIAAANVVGIPTLALNDLTPTQTAPGLLFQFALNPETEARLVVRRARSEGLLRAMVLVPANEWGTRMQRAFVDELQAQGGTLVEARGYDPNARDYVGFLKQVFSYRKPVQTKELEASLGKRQIGDTRNDYDYIFVATSATQARQLRPALRFILPDNSPPVFATSDSLEAEAASNSDLNDTRIADMPWVINRDGDLAQLHDQFQQLWGSGMRARSRLYAFGIDAWRLTSWLRSNQASLGATLRGATGLLAMDASGRILRRPDWARIVNGQPQLMAELPFQPH